MKPIRTLAIGLACLLQPIFFSASAQTQATARNLEMKMSANPPEHHGLPSELIITITNISNHDIRMPDPHQDCGDIVRGAIWLRWSFNPTPGSSSSAIGPGASGHGCAADYFQLPNILERVKSWKTLQPGQSLIFVRNVESEASMVSLWPPPAGAYEFGASFTPPFLTEEDQRALRNAGYDFPQPAESNVLSFRVEDKEPHEPQEMHPN